MIGRVGLGWILVKRGAGVDEVMAVGRFTRGNGNDSGSGNGNWVGNGISGWSKHFIDVARQPQRIHREFDDNGVDWFILYIFSHSLYEL